MMEVKSHVDNIVHVLAKIVPMGKVAVGAMETVFGRLMIQHVFQKYLIKNGKYGMVLI